MFKMMTALTHAHAAGYTTDQWLCRLRSVEHHNVNSSSHSVNGDIAIQWEWSNFDHS